MEQAGVSEGHIAPPLCPHITECNGCPLGQEPYERQLGIKAEKIEKLFGRRVEVEPAIAQAGYRNKAELSYINGLLGYRRKDDFMKSFQLRHCAIISGRMDRAVQDIYRRISCSKAACADINCRKAGLRYVVVRESGGGEIMANFTFFGNDEEQLGKVREICSSIAGGGVGSANILLNGTWSDTAHGKVIERAGTEFITENFLGKKFLIAPGTFFQTNAASAQRIFSILGEYVPHGSRALDLYCGVGTISICISDKCASVLGVESNPESIESAFMNAQLNGCTNAAFMASDVAEALGGIEGFGLAVLDPPRCGMQQRAARRLAQIAPERIIYVSCNPKTLADDLAHFGEYEITLLRAFDQFPQTNHVEMLCVLDRRKEKS